MSPGLESRFQARSPVRQVLEIRPTSGWKAVDLHELWEFRELLWILAWRDLKVRYRQTLLGVLWVVGQPLLAMLIFTFLFNRVAKLNAPQGLPYPIYVLSGLLAWNFFSAAVASAGNSLIGSTHLISKVYFPRLIIPLSAVLVFLVDLAVSCVLLAALLVWYGIAPDYGLILVPFGVLLAFVLSTGLGLWLSALNVQYRDIRFVVPFLLQFWMYATPVAYPVEALPAGARALVTVNPMTGVVQAFRAGLPGMAPDPLALGVSCVVSVLVLVSGAYYFRRMERQFADVL